MRKSNTIVLPCHIDGSMALGLDPDLIGGPYCPVYSDDDGPANVPRRPFSDELVAAWEAAGRTDWDKPHSFDSNSLWLDDCN